MSIKLHSRNKQPRYRPPTIVFHRLCTCKGPINTQSKPRVRLSEAIKSFDISFKPRSIQ